MAFERFLLRWGFQASIKHWITRDNYNIEVLFTFSCLMNENLALGSFGILLKENCHLLWAPPQFTSNTFAPPHISIRIILNMHFYLTFQGPITQKHDFLIKPQDMDLIPNNKHLKLLSCPEYNNYYLPFLTILWWFYVQSIIPHLNLRLLRWLTIDIIFHYAQRSENQYFP